MRNLLKLAGILAVSVSAIFGAGLNAPNAGAVTQIFGTAQGSNWVIGNYQRDGVTASVPSTNYSAGGGVEVYAQFSNSGNIARLAVGFTSGPCTRALGTATGYTWGDAYCYAV